MEHQHLIKKSDNWTVASSGVILTNMFNGATAFKTKYSIGNTPSSTFFNVYFNNITLDSNGTTLKLSNPNSRSVGDKVEYNGDIYLVVSNGTNSGYVSKIIIQQILHILIIVKHMIWNI